MKKNKKVPLFKCNVIHSLPGRVRIGCRALKYLKYYEKNIEKRIAKINVIKSVKVNILTENVLINYKNDIVDQENVLAFIEEVLSYYTVEAHKKEREALAKKTVKEREIQQESLPHMIKRIGIVTGALAYSIIKKDENIGLPLYKKFTTVPALTSLYLSYPFFKSGISSLKEDLRPNADALTVSSIIASLLAGNGVSSLMIILLSDIAELLTSYTMVQTRKSIEDMLSLKEEYAWKQIEDGSVSKVKIESLKPEDLVIVHAGEKITVDGQVVCGEAVVDQSSVTGEFIPVIKKEKDSVFAGTLVKNGDITIKTEKAGDKTVVSRIVHLVEDAVYQRAPIQNYADQFSSYLIPFNFLFAGITYLATKSSSRALNMLVIDFSCGIRLSTAAAFSAAINTAVRNGVLIKGGNYIEALSKADTLILDKTGTLTEGRPEVKTIIKAKDYMDEKEILALAAAAEEVSKHPMAVAVLNKARALALEIPKHKDTKNHISRGIETIVGEDLIRVGSKNFMIENKIDVSFMEEKLEKNFTTGQNIIYVSKNKKLLGSIIIEDKMRENMKKSLNNLRYQGINEMILLTGDTKEQAEIVATKMGVDSFEAELLPEDKAKAILKLQSKGSGVIMIGDGVNDAPALSYADVGISLGKGTTDVAMETSDITVQLDNPMVIPEITVMSKKTMDIISENFGIVLSINSLGLILGAAGVLPVFWGAVLHNSSTIFVVANSLRLFFYNFERSI
ncbi:heavy metal translocating P-type ATPase [Clostridium botulinum]|uniref:heavy metal translocating P-type ATPase n=1 Tax=Clostridium botulinum TaxID=1491 RepID=UPI001FADD75F|nr:cation-translocating P-type ATPase [Clostridium botulinum]